MQDCSESRSSEMFVWFGFSSSKLLTTLKIQVYFEMITLWAVSNLGQVGFQEILSSIRGNKLGTPNLLTLQVLWIFVGETELINRVNTLQGRKGDNEPLSVKPRGSGRRAGVEGTDEAGWALGQESWWASVTQCAEVGAGETGFVYTRRQTNLKFLETNSQRCQVKWYGSISSAQLRCHEKGKSPSGRHETQGEKLWAEVQLSWEVSGRDSHGSAGLGWRFFVEPGIEAFSQHKAGHD